MRAHSRGKVDPVYYQPTASFGVAGLSASDLEALLLAFKAVAPCPVTEHMQKGNTKVYIVDLSSIARIQRPAIYEQFDAILRTFHARVSV